jgi:glutathione peroxidase
MKKTLLILALFVMVSCKNSEENLKNEGQKEHNRKVTGESIHQFTVKDINGNDFNFASLKGKKIMIVNTASNCELASQFEQLQVLYEELDNFVVVGFPSNNFENQEPGTNAEIAKFCKKNYGVTFPMMQKISVKGNDMSPVYKFLTSRIENGIQNSTVEWNFQKYLLDEEGQLVRVLPSQIVPLDQQVIKWIKSK